MENIGKVPDKNSENKKCLRVAIDFGGVITKMERGEKKEIKRNNNSKHSHHIEKDGNEGDHESTCVNMPYVKEELNKLKSQHKLFINSFCGFERALKTDSAIKSELPDIFEECYFVKDRKYKGQICKALGCHVLIDDRLDVLRNAKQIFPELQCILFYSQQNVSDCEFPIVSDWRIMGDVLEKLIEYKEDLKPYDDGSIYKLVHNLN
jgi:hypothetical protein